MAVVVGLGLGLALGPLVSTAQAEAGRELTVRVLTISPGDHPLFSLGESAIWIQDERASRGTVYTFGPVKPNSPVSVLALMAGQLTNQVSRIPIDAALETYRAQNRTVNAQELEIVPAARVELQRQLDGDQGDYPYDPFRSSGATRVRDAVDRAANGRLQATISRSETSGSTLRQQALSLTRDLLPAQLLVDIALGAAADRAVEPWNGLSIPARLEEALRGTGKAGSWNAYPLVASEGLVVAAPREPPRQGKGPAGGRLLVAGLVVGTLLALNGRAARRRPPLRALFGGLMGLVGLLLGLLGSSLMLGWVLGQSPAGGRNENVFLLAPWAVVLPGLAAGVAAGRPGVTRWAFRMAAAAAALASVGLLVKATPWFQQDNLRLIGLFLPIWTGLTLGLGALERR